MTPEEMKNQSIPYGTKNPYFYVYHTDTTFSGLLIFDKNTTFAGGAQTNNTTIDVNSQVIIGIKSFLSSDQKHHNLQFMIGKQIPL